MRQIRFLAIIAIIGASAFILWKFPINLGLDIQGGSRLVFQAQKTEKFAINDESMSGLIARIRSRVDALGVGEPLIQRKGSDQVVVELPGIHDPDRAVRVVGDTALLEFIEAEEAPVGLEGTSRARIESVYGKGVVIVNHEGRTLVLKGAVLTGADLKRAWPDFY